MEREFFEKKVKECLFIEEEEKVYWLSVKDLPLAVMKNVVRAIDQAEAKLYRKLENELNSENGGLILSEFKALLRKLRKIANEKKEADAKEKSDAILATLEKL